jgi:hypothetical protein
MNRFLNYINFKLLIYHLAFLYKIHEYHLNNYAAIVSQNFAKWIIERNEELSSTENCKIIKATPAVISTSDFDRVTNVQNFIQWNPIFVPVLC